jgi:hypothetical protein
MNENARKVKCSDLEPEANPPHVNTRQKQSLGHFEHESCSCSSSYTAYNCTKSKLIVAL